MYKYKATILSCYDSDTYTVLIDLGFNINLKEKIRLLGIDSPEIRTSNKKEKALAYEARDYIRKLIEGKEVIIETEKTGKYGRYLANVFYDDININNELIRLGYARPYDGGKREKWFKGS